MTLAATAPQRVRVFTRPRPTAEVAGADTRLKATKLFREIDFIDQPERPDGPPSMARTWDRR
jgi:hypothetical protein